jgi:hypothetical protein
VEEFLDAYALSEDGMRMHAFAHAIDPETFLEMPECKICGDLKEKHNEFRLCKICYGQVQVDKFYKMEACSEPEHSYCRDCWKDNINSKLLSGMITKIKCLDYCCEVKCSNDVCKELLSPDEFKRYMRFTNAYLKDTNKDLISCPNPECVSLISLKQRPLSC